jgi:histidine triad (HIT) family protein
MSGDFYCDNVLNGRIEVARAYETSNVLAYHHTRPYWQTHIVVIPKSHIPSLLAMEKQNDGLLVEMFEVIREVAAIVVQETGAARVLTNLGEYQDSKHLHFHVYSGSAITNEAIQSD